MSRHGYSEDCDDNWAQIKWRGQVVSAMRGRRGQAFLKELVEALDSLPAKRLIQGELQSEGEFCAIGSVGAKRGVDLKKLDVDDYEGIAKTFGIAHQLVQEIEYENDADYKWTHESPEDRWLRVREWAVNNIKPAPQPRADSEE